MSLFSPWINTLVVYVIDGDTIIVRDKDKQEHRIRLAYIDAPEIQQPYGEAARRFLNELIIRKTVKVKFLNITDKYNRLICIVKYNDININTLLVRTGMAWACRRRGGWVLKAIQCYAKLLKRGLWGADQSNRPIAPQQWRKSRMRWD